MPEMFCPICGLSMSSGATLFCASRWKEGRVYVHQECQLKEDVSKGHQGAEKSLADFYERNKITGRAIGRSLRPHA